MTTKTFENKNGDIWTWEETPESLQALADYWKIVKENHDKRAS